MINQYYGSPFVWDMAPIATTPMPFVGQKGCSYKYRRRGGGSSSNDRVSTQVRHHGRRHTKDTSEE